MPPLNDPLVDLRSERIFELSTRFNTVMSKKIEEITSVNRIAKMLSLNAMVVAARAGEAGRGFSIVAEEFKKLSGDIHAAVSSLESQAHADLEQLTTISGAILDHLRRQRLADLALNAIEIIDRNLYERTCDVRWWATDSAIVACLETPSEAAARYASRRLKVILDAYTVYLDLWVCDASGRVVANGSANRYPSVKGSSVADEPWFLEAMRVASGDEFVAGDIAAVGAFDGSLVATYATAVREGAETKGKPIGVLGIHFDWRPQAQAVVDGVRLSKEDRARSRVMILDRDHRVLAASDAKGVLNEIIDLKTGSETIGHYEEDGKTVGFALTPGYETYKGLGWYGCLIETRKPTDAKMAFGHAGRSDKAS